MRGVFADGMVRGANGGEIIVGEFFHGDAAHVVPEPVGIYFVADDVIPNSAMSAVGGAITPGQEIDAGGVGSGAFGCGEIEGSEIVWRGVVILRMKHEAIERFVAALVVEEDKADDHASVRERFNLAIEGFEIANIGFEKGGIRGIQKLSKVDVERGVLDAKRESVINHLDLQTFFGSGQWKLISDKRGARGWVLGVAGRKGMKSRAKERENQHESHMGELNGIYHESAISKRRAASYSQTHEDETYWLCGGNRATAAKES